jgi:RNA polymerase sigma factor (sigma-70 family)
MSKYYRNGEELSYPKISHEDERVLFAKARAGDQSAKDAIIHNHLLFAASLGRSLAKGRLPEDEVVSAANYALMLAFQNFDPRYPNRFAAFIRSHVRGAIARLWSEKNLVSKSDFSDDCPISTCELLEDDIVEQHPVEENDHHKFLLDLLEKTKQVLDERETKIFDLLYCEERNTLSSVGAKLNPPLTRERVRQIHDEALNKLRAELRRQMNENGINQ